jgi:hypothetical protein
MVDCFVVLLKFNNMDNLKDRLAYLADISTKFTFLRTDSRRRSRVCDERQYIITEKERENILL